MLDRIAELFIFGFAPLVVGMLAVPQAGDRDVNAADKEKAGAAAPALQEWLDEDSPAQPTISVSENQ
jgi:hypothetical protein